MPKTTPIDIPVISGIKRQVESNDKPPYVSSYIRDMWQQRKGVWERRAGYAKAYPDRGQHYDFVTPENQRNITYTDKVGENESGDFRLSHKRKVLAVGESGGSQYVFAVMVRDFFTGAQYQNVRIYRGLLGSDGVTVAWATDGVNTAYASSDDLLIGGSYDIADCYHECSMVLSNDKLTLYLAVSVHIAGLTDYIRLYALTDLYTAEWSPTWTEVEYLGGALFTIADGGGECTHDVDIDIDSTGVVHVVSGFEDSGGDATWYWYFKYDPSDGEVTRTLEEATTTVTGFVLKNVPVFNLGDTEQMCMFYIKNVEFLGHPTSVWTVMVNNYAIDSHAKIDDAISYGIGYLVHSFNEYSFTCGVSLAIDNDGTIITCYRASQGTNALYVKIGAGEEIEVCSNVRGSSLNTDWDLVVKDGVIAVYYERLIRSTERILDYAQYRLVRKVLVYDTLDADYTDGAFGAEEFIEEGQSQHKYVCCYNTYEADPVKRCLTIRTYDDNAEINSHYLDYIRMDRGLLTLGGVQSVEILQKSVHDYNAAGVDSLEELTVIQCESPEGLGNDLEALTRYRFYYRGVYQWMLLEGQMDECRRSIIQETTITDRARFWDNNGVLRAGCGIEDGNTPIWYGLIDRHIYRNEERYQLRGRRFRLSELPAPIITGNFENGGVATITVLTAVYDDGLEADDNDFSWFYDRDSLDANDTGKSWAYEDRDNGDTSTVEGFRFVGSRISSKYRTIGDGLLQALADYLTGKLGHQDTFVGYANDMEMKLPYTEVYLGFAFRYDNGQISQITLQSEPAPFILGTDVSGYSSAQDGMFFDSQALVPFNYGLTVKFRLPRWELGGNSPRITSVIVFRAEKTAAGQHKDSEDLVWNVWKEFYVARPYLTPFKDNYADGDGQWINPDGEDSLEGYDYAEQTNYLDWGAWNKNLLTENAVDYIGTGAILNKEPLEKHTLDGYVQAIVARGRPFYLGIRLNDEKLEEAFIWGVDSVNGGAMFVSPDVISPAFMNLCKFLIKGGKSFNTSNIVIIGDTDIEYGSVEGEGNAANWLIRGTEQDVGCLARDSIVNLAEVGYDNGMGTLYIDNNGYTRLFQSYGSRIVGNDVFKAFVRGSMPVATRTETTYGGLESLAASNAMAVYLAQYRLLMIGFPSSSLMLVRNFAAEGGEEWAEWRFANVPLAWCVAPGGYLLFTDGAELFKWDGSATDDDGTAIQPQGILADVAMPINGVGEVPRIGASYICAGTTLKLTVIRDDGERTDQYVALPAKTVKGWEFRRVSWQKPVRSQFAVKWELTTPADCTKFELHALKAEVEVERYE
jgi:hypothetical protein